MSVYSSLLKNIGTGSLGFAKGVGSAAAFAGTSVYSLGTMASKVPWWASIPIATGIGLALNNTSKNPMVQLSRSPLPSMQPNPSGYNSTASIRDMGAGGDLVMALNNLAH